MKKITLFLLWFVMCLYTSAQTTALIKDLKDDRGTTITYVGEVKGGVPDGLGMALYGAKSPASYYVGYFVKGVFSGKGYMIFQDGNFKGGEWSNGKLNGKAAYHTAGAFYIGDFVNGRKEGDGVVFFKDNGFSTGRYLDDQKEGRSIYISPAAVLSDNIYQRDKKNGSGYQYDLENKKLFEGVWKDGNWVNAATASYQSFLKGSNFYVEKTANQIIIGGLNKETRKLNDTAFFYSIKDKYRRFGKYENGVLTRGVIIEDDSTRFIGSLSRDGAQGQGSFMKMNQYYDAGTYLNDQLNGPNNLSIDIAKKTVYYGDMVNGKFTGKAFFMGTGKTLSYGDYTEGKFTGNGWQLSSDGTFMQGKWKDGIPVSVTTMTKNGKLVVLAPKTIGETITLLHDGFYNDNFEMLEGVEVNSAELDDPKGAFALVNAGLLTMTGASKNYIAVGLLGGYTYIGTYSTGTDLKKASGKYDELCNAVINSKLILKPGEQPVLLSGTKKPADGNTVFSKFYLPGRNAADDFHLFVVLRKVSDSDYRVYITAGDADLTDEWLKRI